MDLDLSLVVVIVDTCPPTTILREKDCFTRVHVGLNSIRPTRATRATPTARAVSATAIRATRATATRAMSYATG